MFSLVWLFPVWVFGNLTALILDMFLKFLLAPNIFFNRLISSPVSIKEAGQDLIMKILL